MDKDSIFILKITGLGSLISLVILWGSGFLISYHTLPLWIFTIIIVGVAFSSMLMAIFFIKKDDKEHYNKEVQH